MKLCSYSSIVLLVPALLLLVANTPNALAQLDCSDEIQVSRAQQGQATSVCDHFGNSNPESYRDWYDSKSIASRYQNTVYIPGADPVESEQNGVAVHWKVEGEYVHLAIAARATGWIGFGIGEAGGMLGADMVLFEAAKPNEVVDAYTNDMRFPQPDDCAVSDWEFVSSQTEHGGEFIMFETKRLLNTNDPQDRAIVNDASPLIPPHRVIAAWGNSVEVGYHGLNVARGSIRFFGTGDNEAMFHASMDNQAEGTFEVLAIDHEIAGSVDTEYVNFCVSRQQLLDQGVLDTQDMLNVIGFEPVVSENSKPYVHHFTVSGSQIDSCDDENAFMEMAYVWAPGEGSLALPDTLGAPLFGEDGYQAFMLEIHYNNPQLNTGVIDNSGVRFYWTSKQRAEQVGILSVGDPWVNLYGQAVGSGLTLHEFDCPGSCSSLALVDRPKVTVLREYLHMHQTGLRMTNDQIRDGEVIRSGRIDYWEFDQNGNAAALQEPFEILPGDGFKTSCYFEGNANTKFGLSSQEEMCMAFLYYHPRVKIEVNFGPQMGTQAMPWAWCGYDIGMPGCDASYETSNLSSKDDLDRIFGAEPEECSSTSQDEDETSTDEVFDQNSGSIRISAKLLASSAWVLVLLAGHMFE